MIMQEMQDKSKINLLNFIIHKISNSKLINFEITVVKKFVINFLRSSIIKYKFKARRFFN